MDHDSGKTPPGMAFVGPGDPRRRIDQDDIEGWLDAAAKRRPPRPKDRKAIREHMERRHPFKWRQLMKLMRWFEKECDKIGLNPEDARWML